MSYAAVRWSTDWHTVSSGSLPPWGARKAYWFKAAEVNNCLFINGMGLCDLLMRGGSGTGSLHAGKPCPSGISADSKCSLWFKAKFTVALTDSKVSGAL